MNQGGRGAERSADPGPVVDATPDGHDAASAHRERMSVRAPDGTEIAVYAAGAGPPLLFVHGMGGDHSRWDPLLPFFEDRFRVHALDRRGRGSSGDGLAYSVSKEAADIAAVIEALGPSVAVVAHSFGALCTAEAALSTTSIGRLVLYEPPFLGSTDGPGTSDLDDMERLVAEGLRSEALRWFMEVRVQMSPHDIEVLAALPSWESREAAAHTLAREIRVMSDYEFDEVRWAGVGIPVLLLIGDRSRSHLLEATRRLDRALPDSTIVVLRGQGHVAMDTDLEGFMRAVREFLAQDGPT
jgi:pimeloyl-ACP methyl ester carboxylesterase